MSTNSRVLTSEQDEQWRAAIMPLALGYLDGYELTEAGLLESMKRLQARKGPPDWAIEVRKDCIARGWSSGEAWVPEFALRSETALVGLRLLYPKQDDRVEVYRQLLLSFLLEVLQPFSDWPEIGQFQELCALPKIPPREWERVHRGVRDKILLPALKESQDFYMVVSSCLGIVQSVRFEEPDSWWRKPGANLAERLIRLYTWHIDRLALHGEPALAAEARAKGPVVPIAVVFLSALEAECPTPEWLSE